MTKIRSSVCKINIPHKPENLSFSNVKIHHTAVKSSWTLSSAWLSSRPQPLPSQSTSRTRETLRSSTVVSILASDWSRQITWPEYWSLIGPGRSRDLNTGMVSDWSMFVGSKVDISRIEFDQCDEFPCIVHHDTTATGRAHMVANAATDSLTCKVIKILSFIFSSERCQRSEYLGCVSVFELWKEMSTITFSAFLLISSRTLSTLS